jgi:hypothetical protein
MPASDTVVPVLRDLEFYFERLPLLVGTIKHDLAFVAFVPRVKSLAIEFIEPDVLAFGDPGKCRGVQVDDRLCVSE